LSRFTRRDIPLANRRYTNKVVTRWYRSPELLLGLENYDASIDMWSVGCILGELLLKERALFMGENDTDQLVKIFDWCGTPDLEDWPSIVNLPYWHECQPREKLPNTLRERFRNVNCSDKAVDLLEKLLVLNPEKRITAKECLEHDWFWENGNPLSFKTPKLPKTTTNTYTASKQRKNQPKRDDRDHRDRGRESTAPQQKKQKL